MPVGADEGILQFLLVQVDTFLFRENPYHAAGLFHRLIQRKILLVQADLSGLAHRQGKKVFDSSGNVQGALLNHEQMLAALLRNLSAHPLQHIVD